MHVAERSLTLSFSLKIAGVGQETLLFCRASDGTEAWWAFSQAAPGGARSSEGPVAEFPLTMAGSACNLCA